MSRVLGYAVLIVVVVLIGRAVIYDPVGSAQFVRHVGNSFSTFACHVHLCPSGGQP